MKRSILAISMACPLVSAAPAAVNDLYPTDFYGVAEGHGTITGYVFDRKQIGNYVNGRHSGEIAITSHIGALRMSRCFSLAGWKVAPVMIYCSVEPTELRISGAMLRVMSLATMRPSSAS